MDTSKTLPAHKFHQFGVEAKQTATESSEKIPLMEVLMQKGTSFE